MWLWETVCEAVTNSDGRLELCAGILRTWRKLKLMAANRYIDAS
jgi:hypothetical protein